MPEARGRAGNIDGDAIERLLEKHGGKIYQLGVRLCGSHEEAEDLLQDTFLLAFRKWRQFEGRSDPATWLYTIASRACWRRKRRRAGQPRTLEPLSSLLPGREDSLPDLTRDREAPLEGQLRREMREAVDRAIAELPLHYRMPLVLKDLAELSVTEVAEILSLKEATVKTRVHRARVQLRAALSKELPQRPAPPAAHERQICLDLLTAKQEALDKGLAFPVPDQELCDRCRSLFDTLDLTRDVCLILGRDRLPAGVRELVLRRLSEGRART